MYGSGIYGQQAYGGEHGSSTSSTAIQPPAITAPFTVFAPVVAVVGEQSIEPPLVTSAFQVFPPASIESHSRPLAEDIRIMRVRRTE